MRNQCDYSPFLSRRGGKELFSEGVSDADNVGGLVFRDSAPENVHLRKDLDRVFTDWHEYRYWISPGVLVVSALPKEIVVNKNRQLRYWKFGLVPGMVAIATLVAAIAWAAQPGGAKKSQQDNEAAHATQRDNPPSAANRQANGAGQQPVQKSMARQLPPSQVTKIAESKPATRDLQLASAVGNRVADVDKDKKDKGNKGDKGTDTKQPPTDRVHSPNTNKGVEAPAKKSATDRRGPSSLDGKKSPVEDVHKNTLPPPPSGNKSTVEDVRKRLDQKKGVRVTPDHKVVSDAVKHDSVQKNMFQERLTSGDLKRLTEGETAKKLKFADQYREYQKGDVARRLELERHGNHGVLYHGVISPAYKNHCMKYNYWGPAFFAGVCLYPHWNPWVEWSWHLHCRPYWDPRPMWCRPLIYGTCPVWVYWETLAWAPLPAVACGTWVDLKHVELPPDEVDLQLLAVRFVDPGHPEEKLGPRYRVWFRNNGSQAIEQPFDVMLFAGNDNRLAEGMAQAGVRVTAMAPAEIQSVDIRLPAEVYAMGRDSRGNPTPFSVLQVLVDANQQIAETTKVNNGARLAPAEILPVDPATFELKPEAAKPGEEILLAGEGFGPQPGRVLVQVNGREMDGEILGWYDLGVQWTLPRLALAGPVEADVVVIRGDGAAANPVKITLTP